MKKSLLKVIKTGDLVKTRGGTGLVVKELGDVNLDGDHVYGVRFIKGDRIGMGHSLDGLLKGEDRHNGLWISRSEMTPIEQKTKKQLDIELLIGD